MTDIQEKEEIALKKLSLEVHKEDGFITFSSKPPKKHMNIKELVDYERNKIIVRLKIFDEDYIDSLNEISRNLTEKNFSLFSFIKSKFFKI